MRAVLLLGMVTLTATADDWPQWRGVKRDGTSAEKGLLKKWPGGGPKLLWKTDKAGNGLSCAASVKGFVYTMGTRGDDEYALAFDDKGGIKWETKLGPVHDWKGNQWSRGPHSTPSVVGDRVYCLTSKGLLACLKTDGSLVWKKDLPTEMKAQVNPVGGGVDDYGWGYSWSPLVVGDLLLITPGGPDGLFAALDRADGKEKWRSAKITEQATYGSPAVGTVGGVEMAFTVTQKTFYAVSMKDGSLIFKKERDEDYADVVTPTPMVAEGKVYFSVGYAGGSEVYESDGKGSLKRVWENKRIGSKQGGVVLVGDYLYGFNEDREWVCQDFKTGTKFPWPAARQGIGVGSVIAADGMLFIQGEDGTVGLVEASPKEFNLLSSFKLPAESKMRKRSMKVWAHPTLSDGRLYVRDQELLFCYEVK